MNELPHRKRCGITKVTPRQARGDFHPKSLYGVLAAGGEVRLVKIKRKTALSAVFRLCDRKTLYVQLQVFFYSLHAALELKHVMLPVPEVLAKRADLLFY